MKLYFLSARGEAMPLVNNEYFMIENSDGLTTFSAALSTATVGGVDGDKITNVQAQYRGIVLDLRIREGVNVEAAKRYISQYVKPMQHGSLLWEYQGRTMTISGLAEAIEMPRMTRGVIMQISLHCERPFWEDIDFVVQQISEAISLHYFTADPYDMLYFTEEGAPLGEIDTLRTKGFTNEGDVAVGMTIKIVAFDTVTNPIIYDQDGHFLGVGYGDGAKKLVMQSGDVVIIDTRKDSLSVTHNGENVFGKLRPLSTFLQLQTGDNSFSINSDDVSISNMSFELEYKQLYI